LRENYDIFGPMAMPGIDLGSTRFPVKLGRPPTTPDGRPDVADLVYGVHRCVHGHGAELPDGFELLPAATGPPRLTKMHFERGKVRLSDRAIFGLIAVAVLSPVNSDQTVPDGYYLTYSDSTKLMINEWWGRAQAFPNIVAQDPPASPGLTLDFGDWWDDL
jgi:hypothetical protein